MPNILFKFLVEYDSAASSVPMKARFTNQQHAINFVKVKKGTGTQNVKMYQLSPEGFKMKEMRIRNEVAKKAPSQRKKA